MIRRTAVVTLAAAVSACSAAQPPRTPAQDSAADTGRRAAASEHVPTRLGGAYSSLDARRQKLVDEWVRRFNDVTGQTVDAGPFYDTYVKLSAKTTFDAVTHALMTTRLTDESGARMGDALDLIDRVESLRGQVIGASGDRQFRMYAGLTENARETLKRSREFKRGADNSIYHKGYPLNYRQQGGVPSIQFSLSTDGRRADIDVDYRASSFPAALFNGHLTASNSDVRAGNNHDRHTQRWTGFQNWWRSFFGIRLSLDPQPADRNEMSGLESTPRAGKKSIDIMVHDFLTAWLVEGDVIAAHAYISERAHACLAVEEEDPAHFDRGMAPFALLMRLRAAHQALGKRTSLADIVRGVRLAKPELKVVRQPHHAQFVIYAVPDDVAAAFDCESRLTVGAPRKMPRRYGAYFGTVFYIDSQRNHTVALLWARESGYWKIVSWKSDVEGAEPEAMSPAPDVAVTTIGADGSFVEAARDFLDSWLVRKDYDRAFQYFSPTSYACYELTRDPAEPPAASLEDAGQRLRAALESAGEQIGPRRGLDEVVTAAPPFHPAIRVMTHEHAERFALASVPNAIAGAADCSARTRDQEFGEDVTPVYGRAFGMTVRFLTRDGDAPVLRTLWIRENGQWRITAFGVELP